MPYAALKRCVSALTAARRSAAIVLPSMVSRSCNSLRQPVQYRIECSRIADNPQPFQPRASGNLCTKARGRRQAQDDPAVRKFQRIVMGRDLVFIDCRKIAVLSMNAPSCHGHSPAGRRLKS
jgi:hypothetical protein